MEIYEKHISLDLSAEDSYKHISAKQGDYDSRYLRVTVLSDGTFFRVEESDVVALRCTHEDGTFDMDVGTVHEDGTVSLKIPKSILNRIGSAECDVSIAREGNGLISTSCFSLSVEKSPLTGNIDDGENIITPSELFAEMSATIDAKHKHNGNLEILDKISESEEGAFLFNGKELSAVTDAELSDESENPVQNKVVNAKFSEIEKEISRIDDKSHSHTNLSVIEKFSEVDGKILFDDKEIKPTVDSELSSESESPVQNKVIKAELDKKLSSSEYLKEKVVFVSQWGNGQILCIDESTVGFSVYDGYVNPKVIPIGIDVVYDGVSYNIFSAVLDNEFVRKETSIGYDHSIPCVFSSMIPEEIYGTGYLVGTIMDATRGDLIESITSFDEKLAGFNLHYLEGTDNDE